MNENIEKSRELKKVDPKKRMSRYRGGMVEKKGPLGITFDIVLVVFMLIVMAICILPMWSVLMSSFSDGYTQFTTKGLIFWPVGGFTAEAYGQIFAESNVWNGYLNTFIYVIVATLFGFILNVLGGYVLSRKLLFSRPLSFFVMFTMMFNGGLIPTYMIIDSLGMTGTRWALLIPGCTSAIFMMITSNAFRAVPESTIEAAHIDGAGHITTLFKIMLPQAMSMITVVILNSVILQWNSWYPASIYVPNNTDLWPLQLWVRQYVDQAEAQLAAGAVNWVNYMKQYCFIIAATIPMIIAFPFFLKWIEKGVIVGGVKE